MEQNLTDIQKKALELTGLNEKKKSPKGWIYGKCPFCGDETKFGLKFNHNRDSFKNHLSFNCFRGSCQQKGTEWDLFKHFNVLYLLNQKEFIGSHISLEENLGKFQEQPPLITNVINRNPPIGWNRIFSHQYLIDRGWTNFEFNKYYVGVTNIYNPLIDYIVFLVIEEGENKGYIARSTKSSQWIDDHNREVKLYNKTVPVSQRKAFHPKYSNEAGVEFEKLLFGIDDIIIGKTKTIIIVEGIFDKFNVDRVLNLYNSFEVRCVCTFGKKISEVQAIKLKNKGIENILILYDPDAIDSSKQFGFELEKFFKVKISVHSEKDPGEMNSSDFIYCINNAKSTIDFFSSMTSFNVL